MPSGLPRPPPLTHVHRNPSRAAHSTNPNPGKPDAKRARRTPAVVQAEKAAQQQVESAASKKKVLGVQKAAQLRLNKELKDLESDLFANDPPLVNTKRKTRAQRAPAPLPDLGATVNDISSGSSDDYQPSPTKAAATTADADVTLPEPEPEPEPVLDPSDDDGDAPALRKRTKPPKGHARAEIEQEVARQRKEGIASSSIKRKEAPANAPEPPPLKKSRATSLGGLQDNWRGRVASSAPQTSSSRSKSAGSAMSVDFEPETLPPESEYGDSSDGGMVGGIESDPDNGDEVQWARVQKVAPLAAIVDTDIYEYVTPKRNANNKIVKKDITRANLPKEIQTPFATTWKRTFLLWISKKKTWDGIEGWEDVRDVWAESFPKHTPDTDETLQIVIVTLLALPFLVPLPAPHLSWCFWHFRSTLPALHPPLPALHSPLLRCLLYCNELISQWRRTFYTAAATSLHRLLDNWGIDALEDRAAYVSALLEVVEDGCARVFYYREYWADTSKDAIPLAASDGDGDTLEEVDRRVADPKGLYSHPTIIDALATHFKAIYAKLPVSVDDIDPADYPISALVYAIQAAHHALNLSKTGKLVKDADFSKATWGDCMGPDGAGGHVTIQTTTTLTEQVEDMTAKSWRKVLTATLSAARAANKTAKDRTQPVHVPAVNARRRAPLPDNDSD
ncbi:hypothetical protein GGX14DRAFT_574726 [Mycena pura]|uniref:Uncharacterized protein n=1 Tax=Mycena pura TaxID=153505 RepID=A0AAD6UWM4_9AGAR|nr:hypothetical protein GGX14DRAFT_574726 [Mycena pura]